MLANGDLVNQLVISLLTIALVLLVHRRLVGAGAGLVPAFLACFWMIHWPGAFIYTLPWYARSQAPLVSAGFQLSVYAALAFGASALALPLLVKLTLRLPRITPHTGPSPRPERRLLGIYLILGVCSYLIAPYGRLLPSLGALLSMSSLLVVVGLGLACWSAWCAGNKAAAAGWLAAGLGLPLYTIVEWGFLSFGLYAFISLCCLVASFARVRLALVLASLLAIYLGLSLYVSYMRDRIELRSVIWTEQGLGQRLDRVGTTLATFEWFDLQNVMHLDLIDARINQNVLDGAAVLYLNTGYVEFAQGETLWKAAAALVPRALWPDKPIQAGGNDVVTTYTGIPFDDNTTVGVGQVMEYYINFGATGVVVGFLILGLLVSAFDLAAARALQSGNWRRFAFWYLGGIGFIQPSGALFEISASVAAGLLVAWLVNTLIVPFFASLTPPLAPAAVVRKGAIGHEATHDTRAPIS